MAKGKHATALFEVIHSARRPPQSSPVVKMPPPRSWWKGHSKRIDSIDDLRAAPAEPFAAQATAELEEPSIAAAAPPQPAAPRSPHWAAPEPQYIDHLEPTPIEPMAELPAARTSEPALRVNAGGGEFSFRLSYGGAAAAAFILLLLVAIAFLIGTRTGDAPANDDEATTASTNTSSEGTTGSGMLAAVTPVAAATVAPQGSNGSPVSLSTPAPVSPEQPAPSAEQAAVASQHAARQVGLNYVIIQSYPSQETAQRAADFLIHNDIGCTVKQGLPGWTLRSWYSVIGIRAFDHVKQNAELESYKDRLRVLGNAFAGHNTFNRFEPTAYKWRSEADDDSAQ